MVWVIPFCSPVAKWNQWLGTQKLSGVGLSAQQDMSTLNHLAYTCIHHRNHLAVGDMTMSGWKPTIILIQPPSISSRWEAVLANLHGIYKCTFHFRWLDKRRWCATVLAYQATSGCHGWEGSGSKPHSHGNLPISHDVCRSHRGKAHAGVPKLHYLLNRFILVLFLSS